MLVSCAAQAARGRLWEKRDMSRICLFVAAAVVAAGGTAHARARPKVTLGTWTARRPFVGSNGKTIHYYLFAPKEPAAGRKYPLVVWLHGGLRSNGVGGPNLPMAAFYRDAHQRKQPCFVLRPVAIKGRNWVSPRGAGTGCHALPKEPSPSMAVLAELLDRTVRDHPIDPNSLHVVGASMGGYGVWDVIARHPKKFASAIPICGGGDPAKAGAIKHVRIWIAHAVNDPYVPVRASREMFGALVKAGGGRPAVKEDADRIVRSSADGRIRYTEYTGGGHNAWDRTLGHPQLIEWVFAKRPRSRPAPPAAGKAGR
jgi:predicted peptidase